MTSEVHAPVPTTAVNNSASFVINGSAEEDVMPNGEGISTSELIVPPDHDQITSAGTVEFMVYSQIF